MRSDTMCCKVKPLTLPHAVNIILQREENKGHSMSTIDYFTWLDSVHTCFPVLALEYLGNAMKLHLEPDEAEYTFNGNTAYDYQRKEGCTVLAAYMAMARDAAINY